MTYSGRINYINLAEPVETRIKQSVQYSEIVNDLSVTSNTTVPSSNLLKQISDKVDNASNVNIVTDGTAPSFADLPPAETNTGKVYVVDGTVYISNGTEWLPQGQIKGEKGEKGDKGDGLHLDGSAMTVEQLPLPNPLGNGATYLVNNKIWVYDATNNKYVEGGTAGYGKSAYDVAVSNGFIGTEQEWVASLKGEDGSIGDKGADGKSAYQVALDNGFVGTEAQWLESLKSDGTSLPISANDIAETAVRTFISPTLKSKITRNEEDITALSRILDGFNVAITNGKLTDENVKFDAYDTSGYLTDKIDGVTIARSGNKLVAKSIQGVTVDFNKINLLTGATSNIQQQLNNLSKVVSVHSIVNTKADLPVIVLEAGSTVLVRQDVDHANASTFYVSNGTVWEYAGKINADLARDFTLEPLDIDTETTGILPKTRYEQQNALEVEFDGLDAQFISTNTQDAIKESKSFAKSGIETLTANLATTNSNLAGVKADLQITNDRLTTNETLTTEAKTLAQQAFQSGNSTKKDVVAQLLLKDPKLPITINSSWEEIKQAITSLQTGYKVNGADFSNSLALTDINEGDFVMRTKKKMYDDIAVANVFNSSSTRAMDSVTLPNGNVVILHSQSVGGVNNSMHASLLSKTGTNIKVLKTIQIDVVEGSGFNPRALLLNDTTVIVALSSSSTTTPYSRTILKKVIANSSGTDITSSGFFLADSTEYSGFSVALCKIDNNKFILARRRNSGVAVSIFTNDTASASSFTNHGSEIVRSPACIENLHVFPISKSERRYGVVGCSDASYSIGDGCIVGFEVLANSSNTILTATRAGTTYMTNYKGGYNTRYLNIERNEQGRVLIQARDTDNNNKLRIIEMYYPQQGEHFHTNNYYLSNTPNNSGGTVTDSGRRSIIHDLTLIGENVVAICYKGSSKIATGIVDLRNTNDTSKTIEVINAKDISEGGSGDRLSSFIKFNNNELAIGRLNGTSASSDRLYVAALDVVEGYSKYKPGYDETHIALALSNAKIGDTNLSVRSDN